MTRHYPISARRQKELKEEAEANFRFYGNPPEQADDEPKPRCCYCGKIILPHSGILCDGCRVELKKDRS